MDAVLLDTDVFSFLLRQNDTRAELYRPRIKNKTIALSFITVGELYVWSVKWKWGKKRIADLEERFKAAVIVPYDLELCREYGRVKAGLPAGKTVPTNDLWIAVCAIRHSIPLISHNARHFEGIPRLTLITEGGRATSQAKTGSLFDQPKP